MLNKAGHAVYYKQAASTYHADIDPDIKAVLAPHLTWAKQFAWLVQYAAYKVASALKAKKMACALINSLGHKLPH